MNEQETSLTHFEWIQVYEKLKNQGNYKFLYTDVDAYEKKLNKMLSQDYRYHKNLMKKSEHNLLLDSLKTNFLKISSDLHLLDLPQLALCIDNTFDSLLNCLRSAFLGFTNCVSAMREEHSSNQSKYFSLERCQECQSHIEKIKIESLKTTITLCEGKPSQNQINRLNSQLDDLGLSFEDVELSLMIDEVLQGKENVLNAKNNQITAIYEEIAQYLQNIPKQTLTMGREEESVTEKSKFLGINSISKFWSYTEIQNGLSQMLKDPIRKFITRAFYFFKSKQEKKSYANVETQTQILTDQETIRSLNKSYERLKREFQGIKSAKRQSQRDCIRMIEEKQVNEMKIKELSTINQFLKEKFERADKDLKKVKKSLEDCERSKKQLSQNLIKQYTAEKSSLLKNIHQLSMTLQTSANEVKRLRKATQGSMVSKQIQVSFSSVSVETQTSGSTSSNFDEMQFLCPSNVEIERNNSQVLSRRGGHKMKKSGQIFEQTSSKCSQAEIFQPQLDIESAGLRSVVVERQFSSKTSIKEIKEQSLEQKMEKVELMENNRVLTKFTIKIDEKQGEKRNSNTNSDNFTLGQESIDTSGRIGSRKQSKHTSKQKFNFYNGDKRRETINSGEIRGFNFRQSKKRVTKACSSRMFMPVQHCSPYIGPKHQGEMNWLEIIESNKVKKCFDDLQKELSNEEDIEKIEFVSKLFFSYNELKKEGILDEIESLMLKDPEILKKKLKQKNQKKVSNLKIQIPNLQKTSNYGKSPRREEKYIQMQPSCSHIPLTPTKKNIEKVGTPMKFKETGKRKYQANILHLQNLSTTINTPFEGNLLGDSPIFIKKHLLLLFDSEIYMKKYEKCEQIWGLLESSMMIDSSFGSQCDNACSFILKLQKTNTILYKQCIELFKNPLKYLKKLDKRDAAPDKSEVFKRKMENSLHKRHFSGLPNKENREQKFVNISPSELRHTLIKLFRFHKVIHGKCAHVQEFLAIIGFKPSSI